MEGTQLQSRIQQPYSFRHDQRHRSACSRLRTRTVAVCAAADKSKQPSPVYIEDAGTQTFLKWAQEGGIEFAKLKPATFGGIRGLAASSDVNVDDVIVSVPRAKALTLPPKQRCPCPDFVNAAYWDSAPWFVKLGVRLLHEQAKGPQSELYEYLKQLPRKVDSPVNWSQELVQQLQYPHLVHKVTEQQREWAALYGKFLEQGAVDKTSAPSQQDFFRALSLVRSRTFSGPYVASTLSDRLRLAGLVGGLVAANTLLGGDLSKGLGAAAAVFLFNVIYELVLSSKLRQYAMCPVIDIMNHSSLNTTEVSYDYPRDAFLVAAGAAYAPGEQVFISYGAQTNDSLMQMYGFAEPDNPYDVYVMTSLLKWLEQLQPASQARLDKLNKDGLLSALQEVVITRQGVGAQTLQALRYLLAPAAGASVASTTAVAANAGGGGGSSISDIDASSGQGSTAAASAPLPSGPPSSYETAADDATERKIALVLVHACQQELAVLEDKHTAAQRNGSAAAAAAGGGRRKSSTNGTSGSSSDIAVAQAAAAAFRAEKKKVLLACLEQLTGGQVPSSSSGNGGKSSGSSSSSSSSSGGDTDRQRDVHTASNQAAAGATAAASKR